MDLSDDHISTLFRFAALTPSSSFNLSYCCLRFEVNKSVRRFDLKGCVHTDLLILSFSSRGTAPVGF